MSEARRATGDLSKALASFPEPPPSTTIKWGATAGLTGYLDRDGFRFSVLLNFVFDEWMVLGIVARRPDFGTTVDHVLAEHAHQNLGAFREFEGHDGAQETARRFLYTAPVPASMCACTSLSDGVEPCAETERAT